MNADRSELRIEVHTDSGTKTLGETLEEADLLVDSGLRNEAFDLLLQFASSLREEGRIDASQRIAEELLAGQLAVGRLRASDEAWVRNLIGLLQSDVGRYDEARVSWQRMRKIGEEAKDDVIVNTADWNLAVNTYQRGHRVDAIEQLKVAIRRRLELEDLAGVGRMVVALASWSPEEDLEELLETVARMARDLGDSHLVSSVLGVRGIAAAERGNVEDAEELLRSSLEVARRSDDVANQILARQNLAALRMNEGRYGEAIRWLRRAIRSAESGDPSAKQVELSRILATALHRSGRIQEAREELEHAIQQSDEIGDVYGRILATSDLGALEVLAGNPDQARELLGSVADDAGWVDPATQLRLLLNLAEAQRASGLAHRALELVRDTEDIADAASSEDQTRFWELAAVIALEAGSETAALYLRRWIGLLAPVSSRPEMAWRWGEAASMLADTFPEEAAEFYDKAVAIATDSNDRQALFHMLNDRGLYAASQGDGDRARRDLDQALQVAGRDRVMQLQAATNLGEIQRRAGNTKEANTYLRRAISLAREMGDSLELARTLDILGLLDLDVGDIESAQASLWEALQLHESLDDRGQHARVACHYGRSLLARQEHASAVTYFDKAVGLAKGLEEEIHYVGYLLEALVAARRRRRLKRVTQQLVDLAQATGETGAAAASLAKAAVLAANQGRIDEAAGLYAVGVLIEAVRPEGVVDENQLAERIVRAVIQVISHSDDLTAPDSLFHATANALETTYGLEGIDWFEVFQQAAATWREQGKG